MFSENEHKEKRWPGKIRSSCSGQPSFTQAPAAGVVMLVNPAGLTDAEVRTTFAQMAQAITVSDKAMTAQANRHDTQLENPPAHTMVNKLQDFMRMNPLIYAGSRTAEDPQEFVDEVQKILVAMEAMEIEKAELS